MLSYTMNFLKKEKKNLIKFKFVVDFMNNLLNLLKELDNHNCKTEETIMLMFKVVEKYDYLKRCGDLDGYEELSVTKEIEINENP